MKGYTFNHFVVDTMAVLAILIVLIIALGTAP